MSAAEDPLSPFPFERVDGLLPARIERQQIKKVLPDLVAGWAWWLGETEAEIEGLFWFMERRSEELSAGLITAMRQRTRQIRDHQPLALLGFIAGSAFVAGLGAAVWKSRR